MTHGLKAAFTATSRPLSRALLGPCRALNATRGWRVPIFAYHQVAESGARDGYPWTVTPAAFEAQMRALADEGCPVVSLEAFLRARAAGRLVPGSVVLTFDDGFRGVWLHASPVLKRYGFTATLFLASGLVGAAEFPWIRPWLGRGADAEEWRPLSWDEVREMVGPTLDLGSHTVSHPHLGRLVPAEMAREVAESRRQIQAETGIDVRCLAYPGGIARYGDHSDETRRVVRAAGYTCAVVSEMGRNGVSADPYRLRRFGVGVEDTPALFRAKALGAYTWARGMQWAAQRLLSDSSNY